MSIVIVFVFLLLTPAIIILVLSTSGGVGGGEALQREFSRACDALGYEAPPEDALAATDALTMTHERDGARWSITLGLKREIYRGTPVTIEVFREQGLRGIVEGFTARGTFRRYDTIVDPLREYLVDMEIGGATFQVPVVDMVRMLKADAVLNQLYRLLTHDERWTGLEVDHQRARLEFGIIMQDDDNVSSYIQRFVQDAELLLGDLAWPEQNDAEQLILSALKQEGLTVMTRRRLAGSLAELEGKAHAEAQRRLVALGLRRRDLPILFTVWSRNPALLDLEKHGEALIKAAFETIRDGALEDREDAAMFLARQKLKPKWLGELVVAVKSKDVPTAIRKKLELQVDLLTAKAERARHRGGLSVVSPGGEGGGLTVAEERGGGLSLSDDD